MESKRFQSLGVIRRLVYIKLFALVLITCDGSKTENSSTNDCEGEDCSITCEDGYRVRLGECVPDVDDDRDFDGVPDAGDNCPDTANADQRDCDQDGIGDLCDDESLCGITLSGYISLYDLEQREDRALANAVIEVEGRPLYTQTDENGQYRITNLDPGDYYLLIFQPAQEMSDDHPITLARLPLSIANSEENAVVERDFVIDPPGDVVGAIVFAERSPYEAVHGGIGVYVEDIPYATTVTDTRGRFELRGVPAGEHRIKFVYPDHELLATPVEVVSLSSAAIGVNGELTLPMNNLSEEWAHELIVEVSDLSPSSMITFDLELIPVFPHLSEPVTLRFEGESNAEGELSLTMPASHLAHEVFNIEVSETIKKANLYLLDQPADNITRVSEVVTDSLPASWTDYSELFAQVNQELAIEAMEPQAIASNGYESLPMSTTNERGDEWTIESLNQAQKEIVNTLIRLAPLRYPLAHKYGELALAKTHSFLLNVDQTSSENDLETQLNFTYQTSSWDRRIKLMSAPHPCPPDSLSTAISSVSELGCGFYGSGHDGGLRTRCEEHKAQWERCELQVTEIDLNECDSSEPGVFSCQAPLTIPASETEIRIWITGPTEAEESLSTQEGCTMQCLNQFRQPLTAAATYIPLYPLIHRDLIQDQNCGEPFSAPDGGMYTINQAPLNQLSHCAPNLPPHNVDDQLDACLSQPSRSASGRHLIINGLVADSPQDIGFLGSQVIVDMAVDGNELNPLIVYNPGVVCLSQSTCTYPVRTKYLVSDGINKVVREEAFAIGHLEIGDQDYCWNFSE